MPVPVLIAVPAIASIFGAVKGLGAWDTMDQAKEIADTAAARHEAALQKFDAHREKSVEQLAEYGGIRLAIFDEDLRRLQIALDQIGRVGASDFKHVDLNLATQFDALGLADVDFTAVDAVKAGLVSAGAGATAYLATVGAVGTFATASTGTSIGVLSGAAAWNATLAWLGGGALTAGGLGASVGAAVLGGVVLGPALAIGSFVLGAKADKRLCEAEVYRAKVDRAVQELNTATQAARIIGYRASGFTEIAGALRDALRPRIDTICEIAEYGCVFSDFSTVEQRSSHVTFELAKTLKTLLDTPLITEDGKPAPAAADALATAKRAAHQATR